MSEDLKQLVQFIFASEYHARPKDEDTRRHLESPAAVNYAARLAAAIFEFIQIHPPEVRRDLFRQVPSYEVLLAKAHESTWERRQPEAQRNRGHQSPKAIYRIGPDIWASVKRLRPDLEIPEFLDPVQLPRTLNGFIEEKLRWNANLQDNAPTLWRWLGGELGRSAKLDQPKALDPRRDAYLVIVDGQEERLTYMQFQKILTKSRKPERTLGELAGTLG